MVTWTVVAALVGSETATVMVPFCSFIKTEQGAETVIGPEVPAAKKFANVRRRR